MEIIIAVIIWLAVIFLTKLTNRRKQNKKIDKSKNIKSTYNIDRIQKILKKSWDKDYAKKLDEIKNKDVKDIKVLNKDAFGKIETVLNENNSNNLLKENKKSQIKKWIIYDAVFNEARSKQPWRPHN